MWPIARRRYCLFKFYMDGEGFLDRNDTSSQRNPGSSITYLSQQSAYARMADASRQRLPAVFDGSSRDCMKMMNSGERVRGRFHEQCPPSDQTGRFVERSS